MFHYFPSAPSAVKTRATRQLSSEIVFQLFTLTNHIPESRLNLLHRSLKTISTWLINRQSTFEKEKMNIIIVGEETRVKRRAEE